MVVAIRKRPDGVEEKIYKPPHVANDLSGVGEEGDYNTLTPSTR